MNLWDSRYGSEDYYYGTEPNDFLKANADQIYPRGKVLCLAEGEGRNAVFLAQQGFQVTAVDQSSIGLSKLRRLAQLQNVSIQPILSDLSEYWIETMKWDCIVSIWCHLPKELRKRLHRSVVQGLSPNGILILEAYHPRQLEYKTGGPSDVNLLMTLKELQDEFQGLDFLVAREVDREVHEGKGHFGKSAVTQLICRKNT